MDRDPPYRVVVDAESGKYHVTDLDDRTILSCRDSPSAEHYATLMTTAYELGYKAGYRAAKSIAEENGGGTRA